MAAQSDQAQNGSAEGRAVIRTFVRGRLAKKPEYQRTVTGAEVCRMIVIGDAAGPASSPPRVSLYIRSGEGAPEALRADEAHRCAFGLNPGDMIQAVGDLGPERQRAPRQEILVSEPVRLRARAVEAAGAA